MIKQINSVKELEDLLNLYQDYTDPSKVIVSKGVMFLQIALGNNLIINGDFTNNTDNWTPRRDALLSIKNQALKVENQSIISSIAEQAIEVEIGIDYLLSVDVKEIINQPEFDDTYLRVSTESSTSGDIIFSALVEVGNNHIFSFTATTSIVYVALQIWDGIPGDYSVFDNVSVREILE